MKHEFDYTRLASTKQEKNHPQRTFTPLEVICLSKTLSIIEQKMS